MINSMNSHAGHGNQDSKSPGASDIIKESIENRKVNSEILRLAKEEKIKAFDTTVDYPTSKSDCLNKIVANCNKNKVDLDISIHFNSFDSKANGVEIWLYDSTSKAKPYAERVLKEISKLGLTNRGIKYSKNLAVLKTKNPNMLIECCFVDSIKDTKIYNYKTMAKAIIEGILDKKLEKYEVPYVARVTCDTLNRRKSPTTNSIILGNLKKGDAYTIINVDGKWGQLKYDLGWIHLDYTERVK